MLTSVKAIVDYGKDKPWWIAGFVAVYLGNPLVFMGYILSWSDQTKFRGKVLGITVFKKVSVNTDWMNPLLFVAITFPVYLIWVLINVEAMKAVNVCRDRPFDASSYFETYTPWATAVAIPGLLNLLVWCTSGMEGNIMGFIFALPLLIAQLLYLVMWVYALFSSCCARNQYTSADLSRTSMV
mmetsp:Transcript_31/g.68  ORF Transcript_31/g.68 Transcript_31/m.68 type:complete len:183 (+) Transcript_31:279-827(+)